jgi:hypothetical protein
MPTAWLSSLQNNCMRPGASRQGRTPKDHYAFKCTAEGGAELLRAHAWLGERCFIACTVDLLATGVDIERLNAVVFFRYLSSSILFYQMVGPRHAHRRAHAEVQVLALRLHRRHRPVRHRLHDRPAPVPRKKHDGGDEGERRRRMGAKMATKTPHRCLKWWAASRRQWSCQGRFILQPVQGATCDPGGRIPAGQVVARVLSEAATSHDFPRPVGRGRAAPGADQPPAGRPLLTRHGA